MQKQNFTSALQVIIERRGLQLAIKMQEESRRISQNVNRPRLAIVGAFHGTNVGDNTLACAVQKIADEQQVSSGLQNFYRLDKYPLCKSTICAGGATGVEKNLDILLTRNREAVQRTALVGMDFSNDIEKFEHKILSFLSNTAYITCRSRQQAQRLSELLHSNNISYQPDNAFAYPFCRTEQNVTPYCKKKALGFNALNLFMTWIKGKGFVPGTPLEGWYKKNNSELVNHLYSIGPQYIEFLRTVLGTYADRGWEIYHIPFALEDDLFAKTFFHDKHIQFSRFNPNPDTLFTRVAKCDLFISTRFHALVFALIAGVPCISINYAGKCTDLIYDLGIEVSHTIDRLELINSFDGALEKAINPNPISISDNDLFLLRQQASDSIRKVIQKIM